MTDPVEPSAARIELNCLFTLAVDHERIVDSPKESN